MMAITDEPLLDSFSTERKPAAGRIKLILWGSLFVLLIILVSLVGYQITLTKDLSHQQTTNNNNNQDEDYASLRDDIVNAMDNTADPCQDFYQYSCGGLINQIVLPPGVNMYIPIFNTIAYDNYVIMNDIVNDQWPLINDLYTSCMAGPSYLTNDTNYSLLSIISNMQSKLTDTQPTTLLPLLASLHSMGVNAFFQPFQMDNIYEAGSDIYLGLAQSGISLYPFQYTPTYIGYLAQEILNAVSPIVPTYTSTNAANAVNVEVALAAIFSDADEIQDLLFNTTWSNFNQLAGIDYSPYVNYLGLQIDSSETVMLATPGFFQNLSSIFNTITQQSVSDYLVWRIVFSYLYQYPVTGSSLVESAITFQPPQVRGLRHSFLDFEVLKSHLTAATSFTSQQIDCIDAVDTLLGDFLGLIFTMQVLDDEIVESIHTVTGGIQNSFKNSLPGLTWIDQVSKYQAAYKLDNILQIIGHPNKLDRYRGLLLDPSHFLNNIVAINQRVFVDAMSSIGTPFDRSQNEFSATVVNAFYSPDTNTINFPAGILESPMFSTSFPKILQYARMGYVIGHETTHGFDNNGRLWNAQGVYQPIMDEASNEAFNQQAQCIVDQYDKFEPVPGYFVNGEQTLGENIADLGGVKNAYKAYAAWVQVNGTANMQLSAKSTIVPALTNDQLFFVMMGQTWCTKANDAGLIKQIQTDVHSPSKYRVNGPLANFDSFSSAFNCPANTPMNPSTKCTLW